MSRRIAKALGHLPDARRRARPARRPSARAPQTSRWSPTPATTTSFSIPACARSGGGSVTRPGGVELDVEGVAPGRSAGLRGTREPSGFLPASARSMIGSWLRASTRRCRRRVLGENESGREGGAEPRGNAEPVLRVERVFVVASECHPACRSVGEVVLGPKWRSGRSPATPVLVMRATVPHFAPTLQHISPLFRPEGPRHPREGACRSTRAAESRWRAVGARARETAGRRRAASRLGGDPACSGPSARGLAWATRPGRGPRRRRDAPTGAAGRTAPSRRPRRRRGAEGPELTGTSSPSAVSSASSPPPTSASTVTAAISTALNSDPPPSVPDAPWRRGR